MSRILKRSASTIEATFYVDEAEIDSTVDVTIEVVRDDGTVLVPAGTPTNTGAANDGTYLFTLEPAQTARVDILTCFWTATIGGEAVTLQTIVEIVGAFYFTLAAARASSSDLASASKYTTAQISEARDDVEDEAEDITQVSWVPRYRRVFLDGNGRCELILPDFKPRSLIALSINRVALDDDELAAVVLKGSGVIVRPNQLWPCGVANIDIAYEHGYAQPTSDMRRASLIRIQNRLFADKSGIPDRATAFMAGPGGGNFSLATAGKGSSYTGIPEVDAAYGRHIHPRLSVG